MPKRFIIFSVTYRFQRGFPHSVHSFGPPACLFRVFYFTILVLLARSLDFGRYWKCSSSTYFSITFIHIMLRFSGAKIRLPSSDPTSQSEKDLFSWKFSTSHMSTTTTNYWIRTSTQQVRNISRTCSHSALSWIWLRQSFVKHLQVSNQQHMNSVHTMFVADVNFMR